MEGRMTLCNMSIEAGARAGMVAPDETTFAYLKGRALCSAWRSLGQSRSRTGSTLHDRSGRALRSRRRDRRQQLRALRHLGNESRHGGSGHGRRSRSDTSPGTDADRQRRRASARIHGARSPDTPIADHQGRSRVHRFVHQLAHRRSARRRQSDQGVSRGSARTGHGGSGFAADKSAGRKRRTGRDFHRPPASSGASQAAPCAWR